MADPLRLLPREPNTSEPGPTPVGESTLAHVTAALILLGSLRRHIDFVQEIVTKTYGVPANQAAINLCLGALERRLGLALELERR